MQRLCRAVPLVLRRAGHRRWRTAAASLATTDVYFQAHTFLWSSPPDLEALGRHLHALGSADAPMVLYGPDSGDHGSVSVFHRLSAADARAVATDEQWLRAASEATVQVGGDVVAAFEQLLVNVTDGVETSAVHEDTLVVPSTFSGGPQAALALVGEVMASSVVLATLEEAAMARLGRASMLNRAVASTGPAGLQNPELFRFVANNNRALLETVTRVSVVDARDPTDTDDAHNLRGVLHAEFELEERLQTAKIKGRLVSEQTRNYVTVMKLVRSMWFEWMFASVIALEVAVWGASIVVLDFLR